MVNEKEVCYNCTWYVLISKLDANNVGSRLGWLVVDSGGAIRPVFTVYVGLARSFNGQAQPTIACKQTVVSLEHTIPTIKSVKAEATLRETIWSTQC